VVATTKWRTVVIRFTSKIGGRQVKKNIWATAHYLFRQADRSF